MPSISTLDLPEFSPAWVDFRNNFFAHNLIFNFELDNNQYSLSFLPVLESGNWQMKIKLKWGQAELALLFESSAWLKAVTDKLKVNFSTEQLLQFPNSVLAAAIATALDDFLNLLEKKTGQDIQIIAIQKEQGHIQDMDGLLPFVVDSQKGVVCRGAIAFYDQQLLSGLSGMFNFSPQAPLDCSFLPVCLGLELGYSRVRLAEWKGLQVGDIILPDEFYPANDKQLKLAVSGLALFTARLVKAKIEILDVSMSEQQKLDPQPDEEQQVDKKEQSQEDQVAGISLEDMAELPVRLSFELDSRSLTLDQLRKIKPGMVFQTGKSFKSPVTIKANSRAFAYGDLVNISGQVGIRIVKLVQASDKEKD